MRVDLRVKSKVQAPGTRILWLFLALVIIETSCTTTNRNNPTITTDISGFPLKGGQILMEH